MKFGHCWPVGLVKQMRQEMPCVVLTIDDRLTLNQYQNMHRPFVYSIEKPGLPLHQARETLTCNVNLKMEYLARRCHNFYAFTLVKMILPQLC